MIKQIVLHPMFLILLNLTLQLKKKLILKKKEKN